MTLNKYFYEWVCKKCNKVYMRRQSHEKMDIPKKQIKGMCIQCAIAEEDYA